ncbi:MAG: restriction endonuclease subunit S [bacterium]|nr:restriction endonuclease subunit S [bacterium]
MVYSIIQKSQLEGASRLDAEYYQPEYLDLEKKLAALETKTLEEISKSVISFGAYSLTSYIEWQESGVPYINVGDIHEGYIDFSSVKYISEKVNEILKKSKVSNGQVLLTMAGTIGNAAVAYNLSRTANANQAIAKITPLDGVSPYYLAAFFNSKYGLLQTQREIVSSVQANIFLGSIKKFKIPIFNSKATKEIEYGYKNFLEELENSKLLYSQAENLLLEELGLKDFESEKALWSVISLSEAKKANRLDPDFFDPKYTKLLEILGKKSTHLGDLVKRITKKVDIQVSQEYNYIEISDIDVGCGEASSNKITGKDLPANAKLKIIGGEIIVSKVRPTRGAVAIIPDNWNRDFVASGAFSVFDLESPMRECLQVVLRSFIGKLQLEKPTTGTSYPTITDKDVENILIPILSKPIQQKIAELVKKSHEARKKDKELLEEAKHKVEKLIEKGNNAAIS